MRFALSSSLPRGGAALSLALGAVLYTSSALAAPPAPLQPGEWRLANAGVNRIEAAMAYNPDTQKVILFGGRLPSWSLYTDDTWEFDLAERIWRKLSPAHQPPARSLTVMAFDAHTKSIVLVGGQGPSGAYSDVWSWTGDDWVDITPADNPLGARYRGAVVAAGGGLLLHGGLNAASEVIDGTWTWDGSAWTMTPVTAPAPPSRAAPIMAGHAPGADAYLYDPGDHAADVPPEFWRWDKGWAEVTGGDLPEVAAAGSYNETVAFAYQPNGDAMLLFGRMVNGTSFYGLSTGLWGSIPMDDGPNAYLSMLTVSTDIGVIGFGGKNSTGVVDPGETWLSPSTDAPWQRLAVNTGRCDASMAYDRVGKRVLRFGGSLRCAGLTDPSEDAITRAWDGDNWVDVGETPSDLYPRAGAMMASLGDEVILVGGANGSTFGDTWRWTGASWVPVEVSDNAPRVAFGAMAYDGQGLVLFGGLDESVTQGQTWRFDGSKWSLADSATSPPPAYGGAMAYDAERGDVVMFGGMDDSGLLPGETWVWHGATGQWESLGVLSPSPSARAFAAMSYDQARRRVVLFGGQLADGFPANPEGQPEAWEWDGSGWTDISSDAEAEERGHAAMAYDEAAGALVLFGGSYSSTATQPFHANGDTWVFAARGDGTGGCQRDDGAGMVSLPDGAPCPGGECVAGACVQDPSAPKPDYGSPSGGTSGAGGDASSGSSGMSAGQGGASAEDPDGAASSGCSVGGTGGASAPAASVALLAATLTWMRRRRRTA